jgi:hypothetical protein
MGYVVPSRDPSDYALNGEGDVTFAISWRKIAGMGICTVERFDGTTEDLEMPVAIAQRMADRFFGTEQVSDDSADGTTRRWERKPKAAPSTTE